MKTEVWSALAWLLILHVSPLLVSSNSPWITFAFFFPITVHIWLFLCMFCQEKCKFDCRGKIPIPSFSTETFGVKGQIQNWHGFSIVLKSHVSPVKLCLTAEGNAQSTVKRHIVLFPVMASLTQVSYFGEDVELDGIQHLNQTLKYHLRKF